MYLSIINFFFSTLFFFFFFENDISKVVVFNCQEGMDSKFMGQFFSGLASGGAWACFDEFNRIGIEVLSVIAQQVQTIQKALVAEQTRFDFEGNDIALSENFGQCNKQNFFFFDLFLTQIYIIDGLILNIVF